MHPPPNTHTHTHLVHHMLPPITHKLFPPFILGRSGADLVPLIIVLCSTVEYAVRLWSICVMLLLTFLDLGLHCTSVPSMQVTRSISMHIAVQTTPQNP